MALHPNAGHGLLIREVSRSHTTTHYIRWDSSGRVISSSQRHLPDNTQNSQQTDIHASEPSYMRSVVDRNVVMRRVSVSIAPKFITDSVTTFCDLRLPFYPSNFEISRGSQCGHIGELDTCTTPNPADSVTSHNRVR